MALFDFLKKKKEEKKPLEKKAELIEPKIKKKASDKAHRILYSPHITEKATDLEKQNKYIFKVWPEANKVEIKETIEHAYGVDVVDVRIVNIPRRKRRLGKRVGWKKGYKKAIVRIKKDQKIEILPR